MNDTTKSFPKQEHPNIGTEEHPNIGTEEHPNIGTEEHPNIGTEEHPNIGTKEHPNIGTEEHPYIGTEEHPNIGTQEHPNIGTEEHPNIGTEEHPNIGTEEHPNIGTEEHPNIGTKEHPNIGTEEHPYIGTEEHPNIGTQEHPNIGTKEHPSIKTDEHPNIETEIYSLIDKFSRIAAALVEELESKKYDLEVIQNQLQVLPGYQKSEIFLNMCAIELSGSKCDSIQTLFDVLNTKMWNFLDYHLLKFIADTSGLEEIESLVVSYEEQLDQCLPSIPVRCLARHWDGQNTKPANGFTEIEVKFTSNRVRDITMAELNTFLKELMSSFLPPHSRLVIVHQRFRLDGSLVTYVLPLELASKLKQGIVKLQSQEMFEKYFVEYISISSQTVYEAKGIASSASGKSSFIQTALFISISIF